MPQQTSLTSDSCLCSFYAQGLVRNATRVIPFRALNRQVLHYPPLSEEETEAQSGPRICRRSQSKWWRQDNKRCFVTWQRTTSLLLLLQTLINTLQPQGAPLDPGAEKPRTVVVGGSAQRLQAPHHGVEAAGSGSYQAVALPGPRAAGCTLVVAAVAGRLATTAS